MLGIDASRANVRERTGTEWYSFFVLRHLSKFLPPDLQITWYTKSPPQKDMLPLPERVRIRELQWPPKFLWTQLRLSWEMLLRPPELLFVPAHTIPLVHPRKTITTLHDVGFEHQETLYNSRTITGSRSLQTTMLSSVVRTVTGGRYSATEIDYHRFSARFAVRHAAHLITVSEFSKKEIIRTYGARPEMITVVPNGYSNNVFTPVRNADAERKILDTIGCRSPFIISVGRLELKKNTPNIVRGFGDYKKRFPKSNLKLVLVGNRGYGYEDVEHAITSGGLSNDVFLPGWMRENKYVDLLRAAEAFIFPSLYEGFGIPLLEAMGAGTPIITASTASLPEVAANAALYVDPREPQQIARAIENLQKNPSLRASLIEQGFKRVKDFSWEKTAQQTAQILASYL